MSIDIETAKQDLLNLKEEYESKTIFKTHKMTSMSIGKIKPSPTVKMTCAQV